jgi:formamidopyrimidine-DNA glycosylase
MDSALSRSMLHLTEILQTRVANLCHSIKTFLTDQSRVVKSGNIYALESLFLARISPVRPAKSLQSDEVDCLHPAIRATLFSALGRNLRATELGASLSIIPPMEKRTLSNRPRIQDRP